MNRLLIVDDEPIWVETMTELLRLKGYEVASARDAAEALRQVEAFAPGLVFLDLELSDDGRDRGGGEVLRQLRARWSREELPVIVVSGTGDTRVLQELLAEGADDYEVKPVEFKNLLEKVERFLNRAPVPPEPPAGAWREDWIGKSRPMMSLTLEIWKLARLESDALILGETGTGKNLAAKLYHRFSPRADRPFYEIDCANIAPTLFETEIFGYAQGAYSEARRAKKGRIEEAEGGIAFFNEIGEIPLEQQAKLLTLLETKTITRVGSNEPLRLDVVILAATNRNLEAMVAAGTFRKDLYYRLCHNRLLLPPLRDHREDIPLLVEHFIRKYEAEYRKPIAGAAPEALARLQNLAWEGNVRQLEHCIRTGVQNCLDGTIAARDLEPFLREDAGPRAAAAEIDGDLDYAAYKREEGKVVQDLQRKYFRRQLEKHGGNVAAAARAIGVKREYLNQLLKKAGLSGRP